MTDVPVVWLHFDPALPARGYWDQGMLEDLLSNAMWSTGYKFVHGLSLKGLQGAVVVFPARAQVESVDRLNEDLSRLSWCVLILTGDEESVFPVERISHPNIRIWVMSPRVGRHDAFTPLGTGYAPHLRPNLPASAPEKPLDYFFAGQVTHVRREECVAQLALIPNGECVSTEGFTQGLPPLEYAIELAAAKVAPCPSGPETPDTFRLFEALEAGCVPVADTRVQKGDFPDDYWIWFFGQEPPFPLLRDYADLPHYIRESVAQFPVRNNKVFEWWQHYKRDLARHLARQISDLSDVDPAAQSITVVVSSSPTIRNPETDVLEETIDTVRGHLPEAEIIIMLDGVRQEMEHLRADYDEYKRRVLWLCNHHWHDVIAVSFEEFNHQSGMTPKILDRYVKTPLILFVEHDTPLTPDRPIDWTRLIKVIEAGDANVIRFHHETHVLDVHEHLMLGPVESVRGVPLRKTSQWSQRPHLASTAFYRQMLQTYFTPRSKAFIEHGVYGALAELVLRDGLMGWNLWKLWIYHPDGNILRSYNLNGRGDGPNFDSQL